MSEKPEYLKGKAFKRASERDANGLGKRMTISGHALKVLTHLAYHEMRVGDYNKDVNDLVVSMWHYLQNGLFDDREDTSSEDQ